MAVVTAHHCGPFFGISTGEIKVIDGLPTDTERFELRYQTTYYVHVFVWRPHCVEQYILCHSTERGWYINPEYIYDTKERS